ncbi:ligase-associated DNA damage response endonuclease PdeM [Sulfitobacter sp. M57]|uniref:ligase-associated DNA damage response endonuclease PdeM n=1 Tax=unclassified Sulfitobacter TaxID=196795 RepID=UPI0023E12BFD|nr:MULTISPECIES: ligase-associated DNA damage response endonuclease PdeM [unclassified Sulfitobacter]MDF3412964.1 ligase-associated DNA damage response endonuclease PdeM [Sulfitobacter sp. KE5]MDF3421752.1 ligase-associated DNA damage response endonuclease PdeM [Sulfitobacter sp. KE43]MDF3431513.1 ligase-associated DNA damage response endonuclease PdeM [Sulfitobacter sp. KE42]MDF3457154.1 ligase-associated DNA damage response endonuclease PdeM [Sulfitobacter sp. S74]MDF3461057.1 ligase-associa
MNAHDFTLAGVPLKALNTGALWWPDEQLLCVSDLHLGKSERIARRGGVPLPPYETRDTLTRLAADLALTHARTVICLGDSFDDLGAALALPEDEKLWITRLQAGRRWVWIEGNHDPGPVDLGGSHLAELPIAPLTFRHIAEAGASGEVSGHYHPKARVLLAGRRVTRPAFVYDSDRLILPAYGTYTGGLDTRDAAFRTLMRTEARAVLTGKTAIALPMPRTSQ